MSSCPRCRKPRWKCVTRCAPLRVTLRILAERKQVVKKAKTALLEGRNRQLVAGELKAVKVADHRGSEAFRLEKFASDYLNFLDSDAFEHGDQLLRREMPVEIDVVNEQCWTCAGPSLRARAASHP